MRRAAAAVVAALLLAACSSGPGGSVSTTTPTAASPAATRSETASAATTASPRDSPSAPRSTAVERYCRSVDEFIAASRRALRNPTRADTEELQRMSAELAQQAQALTSELIADPSQVSRVQECTGKLAEFDPRADQG